jgi:dienelactone hydrolase
MKWGRILLSLIASGHVAGPLAVAGSFEGEWIGGFGAGKEWVFVEARFGGEGDAMTGRADLPSNGEGDILLRNVEADDERLSFELPGNHGNLRFEGRLKRDGRVGGSVRQGLAQGAFELFPTRAMAPADFDPFAGHYETGAGQSILLYVDGGTLLYVDYDNGRLGRLFPLRDGRFVSGPSVTAGYPIELTVVFERDPSGRVSGFSWDRRDEPARQARRRTLYSVSPARFASADDTILSGSLLVPNGRGPHPAVVVIPGSGKVTRHALMPFADSLARYGVAVLIHDKRGVGQSTGSYARAGIVELADDALAAIAWLKTQPAINAAQIGVLGTSLGGWAAPLAATRSADVKFIIIEAAPAITPAQHERTRVQNQMQADRASLAAIARAVHFMDRKFEVGRTGKGWENLQELARIGQKEGWLRYVNPPASLDSLRWNWEHVFSFDPQPVLRKLRVPVLALYGELDRIVEPESNKRAMEQALRAAGNTDVTVHVLPAANHHFLAAVTGGPNEVASLKGFVAGYFAARVDWLLKRVDESHVLATDTEPSL